VKRASQAAVERYTQARRALDKSGLEEHAAWIDWETPEFLRLNHAVIEAERDVPWRQRWRIDRRILHELDYWERMRAIDRGLR
jgi:hypothetical protein